MKHIILHLWIIFASLIICLPQARGKELLKSVDQQEKLIFDFKNTDEIDYWRTVNDGVMALIKHLVYASR